MMMMMMMSRFKRNHRDCPSLMPAGQFVRACGAASMLASIEPVVRDCSRLSDERLSSVDSVAQDIVCGRVSVCLCVVCYAAVGALSVCLSLRQLLSSCLVLTSHRRATDASLKHEIIAYRAYIISSYSHRWVRPSSLQFIVTLLYCATAGIFSLPTSVCYYQLLSYLIWKSELYNKTVCLCVFMGFGLWSLCPKRLIDRLIYWLIFESIGLLLAVGRQSRCWQRNCC